MKLKGHTLIELTDPDTGVTESFEESNMITTAVTEVLNLNGKYPFIFSDMVHTLVPLWKTLMGGLYLFDNNISEENIVLPAEANAVGYGAYNYVDVNNNPNTGNYNVSESEETTNYIKLVWDFATDRANGDIGCICLGHPEGAKMALGGFDGSTMSNVNGTKNYLFDTSCSYSNMLANLLSTNPGNIAYGPKIRTFPDTGIIWSIAVDSVGAHIYAVDVRSRNIGALDTKAVVVEQKDFPAAANYFFAGYDRITKKAYFINTDTWSAGATATFLCVDLSSDVLSDATYTTFTRINRTGNPLYFFRTSSSDRYPCVQLNGFLYSAYNLTNKLIKIKMDDDTIYEIILPKTGCVPYATTAWYLVEVNGLIFAAYGASWVYNTITGEMRPYLRLEYYTGSRYLSEPGFYDDMLLGATNYTSTAGPSTIGFYLGLLSTINNLETPVTKTPDKTMKITYTLEISA